jgi:hypothetical protein
MKSRSLKPESVVEIRNSELTPTLQELGRSGITVDHFSRLRRDKDYAHRVARLLQAGGWQLTESEMKTFDFLGNDAMYLAPEVNRVWHPGMDNSDYGAWDTRAVQYRPEVLRALMSSQHTRLVNEATSGVASAEPQSDWRLFYIRGQTPRQTFDRIQRLQIPGITRDVLQAVFNGWGDSLGVRSIVPGYYLVNVHLCGGDKTCNDQGSSFRSAPVSASSLLEIFVTHYLLRGQWGFHEGDWGVCGSIWKNFGEHRPLLELWGNRPSTAEPDGAFGMACKLDGHRRMGTLRVLVQDQGQV